MEEVDGSLSKNLAELIDREAIRDCLMRSCTGLDRCDEDMLLSCFWPDATDIHGDFQGNAHEFIRFAVPALRRFPRTQHFLGNIFIRLDGKSARSEAYYRNWHRSRDASGRLQDVFHGGRLLERLEKRGSEWRIASQHVLFDWVLDATPLCGRDEAARGREPLGRHRPDDMLYTFLGGIVPELLRQPQTDAEGLAKLARHHVRDHHPQRSTEAWRGPDCMPLGSECVA